MRKVLLSVVILALTASVPFAQTGRIGIFSDAGGVDCGVVDSGPGLVSAFVVHINSPGATACEYKALVPSCFTFGVWLADTPVFGVNIGNSQDGISTAYGTCLANNIHVLTIGVFSQGLAGSCCIWKVEPMLNGLNVVDCSETKLPTVGQSGIVNPGGPGSGCECSDIVATRDSTWGTVKALYSAETAN